MDGGSLSRTVTTEIKQSLVTSTNPEIATEEGGAPWRLSNLFQGLFTRSPSIEAEISRLNPLPAITRLNGGES